MFLFSSIFNSLLELLPCFYGAILMFHHIAPVDRKRIQYNEHLKVSPEFLDRTLGSFKDSGFTFISLDELAELLQQKKQLKKVLAITFDDGYKDNLTNGLPVLEQYQAPGTIYVATGLMTGEVVPWWDVLEDYLLAIDEGVSFSGKTFVTRTPEEKCSAFLQLRGEILSWKKSEIKDRLIQAGMLPKDYNATRFSNQMVSADDLKCYADHPLITFGSHTHTHLACGRLSAAEFEQELQHSMKILYENHINVHHFAFPYGDDVTLRPDFVEVLKANQIRSCVTTYEGLISRHAEVEFLPRIFVSEYCLRSMKDIFLTNKKKLFCSLIRRQFGLK